MLAVCARKELDSLLGNEDWGASKDLDSYRHVYIVLNPGNEKA